ncbi:hypothetical protein [Janibacter sp. UYMM211]|uniref:hypothetical protein n=1 Tax=Janibacter sp. UYMM211 TaxID=3156342 RepID=UPI003394FD45
MELDDNDRRQEHIVLDALVSYSDACTLPHLTPSCPYYAVVDSVPTCEEQCRRLIAEWGGGERPVESHRQGSLVLTGRAIPRASASGVTAFDAAERYLRDRALPLTQQSTGSLLLGLEAAMTAMPRPERLKSMSQALDLWDELDRRGLPVDAVVRAGILPTLATHLAALTTIPYVRFQGDSHEVSGEMLARLGEFIEPWQGLLEAAFAEEGSEDDVRQAIRLTSKPEELNRRLLGRRAPLGGRSGVDEEASIVDEGPYGLLIAYAMSGRFVDRVLSWFHRALADDKLLVLGWQPPPPGIFSALRTHRPVEEHGLWLWERNTVTHLDEWSTTSLMAEWRAHEVADHNLAPLVYGERCCDHEQVATTALTRLSKSRPNRPRPVEGLRAQDLMNRAVELLRAGDHQAASHVFSGLVELRPWDGDALNNLGFCLMPIDPWAALQRLEEASLYPSGGLTINVANRVLALALLDRHADARNLAESSIEKIGSHPSRDHGCYVWRRDADGALTLDHAETQHAYLQELLDELSGP